MTTEQIGTKQVQVDESGTAVGKPWEAMDDEDEGEDCLYPSNKPKRYKTAKATISCAMFKAGQYVSVEFSHWGDHGRAWYLIRKSETGPLAQVVAYPANHLTDFCL